MNRQRKVLITITYNERGTIIDTKAEEVAPPVEPKHGKHTETHGVCSDYISRQQAIEKLQKYLMVDEATENDEFSDGENSGIHMAIGVLDSLPSVTPTEHKTTETMIVDGMEMEIDPVSYEIGYSHGQVAPTERTGEWITEKDSYEIICSRCKCEAFSEYGTWFLSDYCPYCGAKMKGEEV